MLADMVVHYHMEIQMVGEQLTDQKCSPEPSVTTDQQ